MASGQQLVEHHAERELIGAGAGGLSEQLFRRHVRRRAGHGPGIGESRDGRQVFGRDVELRQAEVQHLYRACGGHDDVFRFQIAVHDAALVSGRERPGDVGGNCHRARRVDASRRDLVAQRAPFQVLGGDEELIADFFERVDRCDRRVRQRRRGARFLPQARMHARIAKQVRRQRLQRHRPVQPRVVRQVDHAHAAAADDPLDAVGADLRAGCEQGRRLEKTFAMVVRLQKREDFVLHVGGFPGRAHQRGTFGRRRGESAIEQRADTLPLIGVHSRPLRSGETGSDSSFFNQARATVQ